MNRQSEHRQSQLSIDLGGEQINLIRLRSSEALSQNFHVSIDMLIAHTENEIDLMPHLGKPARVSMLQGDELLRHFHGIITDAEFVEEIPLAGMVYRLTLRPRAYLHQQGLSFRIFQNKSAREIIKTILDECNIASSFEHLQGGTLVRKYCVQYRESDFAFASRLMEEEGIYYFYDHTEADHVLTLCDSPGAHQPGKAPHMTYNPSSGTIQDVDLRAEFRSGPRALIQEWRERVETGGEGRVDLTDYDFTRSKRPLREAAVPDEVHPADYIRIHEYPGRYYYDDETGKQKAVAQLAARHAARRTFTGRSQNCSMAVGATFELDHPYTSRYNGGYLITRAQHSFNNESYRSGMGGGDEQSVNFEVVRSDTIWRPKPVTPRPLVYGPETAIVTGPKDEEIYCDEYGRVKVQFQWDLQGKEDENSSCWIRVSQTGGLGNIILPRVGHEVLVEFINGDPDRPLIVGRVFNDRHMPVYDLPEHKTRATWRSKTYKEKQPLGAAKSLDSNDPGHNELRFEDKPGHEEVYFHAQRFMNTRVGSNETHHVGHNQSAMVGNNQDLDVGVNQEINIGANRTKTVGANETNEIAANRDSTVGASQTTTISVSESTTIGVSESRTVGGNRNTTIGTTDMLTVGGTSFTNSGGPVIINSGAAIVLQCGASRIILAPGGIIMQSNAIVSQAMAQVHVGGGGKLLLGPPGGVLSGPIAILKPGG